MNDEEYEVSPEVLTALAEGDAAAARDEEAVYAESLGAGHPARAQAGAVRWLLNLPKNITVGAVDSFLNTVDFLDDANEAGAEAQQAKQTAVEAGPGTSAPASKVTPEAMKPLLPQPVREALTGFREHLAQGSNTADEMTQVIGQFALPFAGWSKAIGGMKGATSLGTMARVATAESAAVAHTFAPEEARFADLIQMGRTLEGRFGDALRLATPDGSAANAFIEYLADDTGDSAMEGRFKNVIDNLGVSAALAGVFKVGAKGLKKGRKLADKLAEAGKKE